MKKLILILMMIMIMKNAGIKKVTALLMREYSLIRAMVFLYQTSVKQSSCLENYHLKVILFKMFVELI